jgi:hypothetical protein
MSMHKARMLIATVMDECAIDARARSLLEVALNETWRAPSVRQAPRLKMTITPEIQSQVRAMAYSTDMTMGQIADRVGLRNAGRVSEILNNKRK